MRVGEIRISRAFIIYRDVYDISVFYKKNLNLYKEIRQLLIGVWYNDKILFEKKSETRTLGNGLLNCAFIDEGKGNFPSYPEWDLNPHGLAATRF